jgi:hypothetical protein
MKMKKMKTKKIRIFLFNLIAMLMLAAGIIYVKATYDEINLNKQLATSCELDSISKFINSYYRLKGSYPEKSEWASVIANDLASIKCGRSVLSEGDKIRDRWGDPYCYAKKSTSSAILLSKNSEHFCYSDSCEGREVRLYLLNDGQVGRIAFMGLKEIAGEGLKCD